MNEMGEPPPYPRKGQHVRVVDGPFAEFDGPVVATDELQRRVQVAITFFGRKTILDVDVAQVEVMA